MDTNGYVPNVLDPQCPTRKVLDRIGDRWTVLVVSHMLGGGLRFTRLRERVGGVTPKALTHTLRAMERDGLVLREVYAEVPPRVEYSLTPLGRTLEPLITAITGWAEANIGSVSLAQADYDARTRSSIPSSAAADLSGAETTRSGSVDALAPGRGLEIR